MLTHGQGDYACTNPNRNPRCAYNLVSTTYEVFVNPKKIKTNENKASGHFYRHEFDQVDSILGRF